MKKIMFLLSIIAILSLFVLGCTTKAPEVAPVAAPLPAIDEPQVEESVVEEEEARVEDTAVASENIIEMTSSGFSPKTIIINLGETVTFVNKDSAAHWPASNVHPTHSTYPGSSKEKCRTAEQATIFDACKGLAAEEEFSFTFDRKGNWPYHDHLNLGMNGVVTVK